MASAGIASLAAPSFHSKYSLSPGLLLMFFLLRVLLFVLIPLVLPALELLGPLEFAVVQQQQQQQQQHL